MMLSFKTWIAPLCLLVSCCSIAPTASADDARLTPQALCDDLEAWVGWTLSTHPDLSWSADPEAFRVEAAAVCENLDGVYDQRLAWLSLSVLNPMLNDAHAGLRYPEGAFEAWRLDGGEAFPLPVEVREEGLFVTAGLSRHSRVDPGAQIIEINGVQVDQILSALLPRMRGESDALRRRVLSLRFSGALWALTGGSDSYVVSLRDESGSVRRLTLDPELDQAGQSGPVFALDWRADVAVLKINTFDGALEEDFATFTAHAFDEIAARQPYAVVIDLRHNGGGSRALSDTLMSYLTGERYTPISAVTARITPENQALVPGSQLGQVIATPFAQWVQPVETLEHRFDGDVFILVGPNTYSQAIVFAATAQDFNVARIAGTPTEGAANQSGQVQAFILPNSGLTALSPIYVFTRASGETGRAPLRPDIPLQGAEDQQLSDLMNSLSRNR